MSKPSSATHIILAVLILVFLAFVVPYFDASA
jgi:hypothetical protein